MYFAFIHNLGKLSIRLWDESRMANNAIEMYEHGDFIIKHFNGNPDNWSSKPPFTVWMQTLSFHLFGINEFTFRLPSALAGILTSLILLFFSFKIIKSELHGILSLMVLISIVGYVGYHVTRTGDNDAILTLWTTLGALSFFSFTENKNKKYLYLGFISFALGVLTKSVAALFLTPGILIYILISRKIKVFFLNKHFYIGIIVFLIISLGYYLLRDSLSPGYINHVLENEIFRFHAVKVRHSGPFLFYINRLNEQIPYWFWATLLIPFVYISKELNPVAKRFTTFSIIIVLTYLLIISTSQTKLSWYIAQVFPIWASLIAIIVTSLIKFNKNLIIKGIILSVFITIFYLNYSLILRNNNHTNWEMVMVQFGYLNDHFNLNEYTAVSEKYSAPVVFYVKKDILNGKNARYIRVHKNGNTTTIWPKNKKGKLEIGDTLVFCSKNSEKFFLRMHNTESINKYRRIEIHTYKGLKENNK